MPLVTPDYFVGEINIVGWESSSIPTRERLCALIATREPEFLEHALGYSFASLFTSGVTNSVPKYLNIKNGAEWKHENGKTYRFNGLAKDKTTISPIANFIYYWWCRDNDTQSTTLGETDTKTDNSTSRSANAKAVRAYNVAANECRKLWTMLYYAVNEDGTKVYPEFDIQDVNQLQLSPINVFGL